MSGPETAGRTLGVLAAVAVLVTAGACSRHPLRAADRSVPVELPRDHAAHDDAQTEWWHFHGHMSDDGGRRYDWFLAFIRQHTDADRLAGLPLRWFVDPFQVALFTFTDREADRFFYADRFAYPDLWVASARRDALALRHGSWKAATRDGGWIHLKAASRGVRVDLRLRALKPPARMGDSGYLHVPPRSSHYYYSVPRMHAEGTVTVKGERRAVHGSGWFKHEWGFLYTEHLAGWVWFGLQLTSGEDVVVALIFDHDWNVAEGSFAAVVEEDGTVTPLAVREIGVRESGETWRSGRTDTVYPTGWFLDIPERDASLVLAAVVDGQEMIVKPANMWAGTLSIGGTFDGEAVEGDCFAEVVGLDRPFGRFLFRSGRPKKKKKKKKE